MVAKFKEKRETIGKSHPLISEDFKTSCRKAIRRNIEEENDFASGNSWIIFLWIDGSESVWE